MRQIPAPRARAVCFLALGLLMLFGIACHPNTWHLSSIHYEDFDESICIEMNGSDMPIATPIAQLRDALNLDQEPPPSNAWQTVDGVKFVYTPTECEDIPTQSDFNIEVHVYEAGSIPAGGPVTEPIGGLVHYAHHIADHAVRVKISVDEDVVNDVYTYVDAYGNDRGADFGTVFLHEMGHDLGLGEAQDVGQGFDRCIFNNEPIISAMHNGGHCRGALDYRPTRGDVGMVQLLANDVATIY